MALPPAEEALEEAEPMADETLDLTEDADAPAELEMDAATDDAEAATEEADAPAELAMEEAAEPATEPASPRMVVEPTMVEKVEPPEVTKPEIADVVIGTAVPATDVGPPAPPKIVVEPMVDPSETIAEVVTAEATVVVVVAVARYC